MVDGGYGQGAVRVWSRWIVGSRGQSEIGLGKSGDWLAAVGGGVRSAHLREKSLFRSPPEPVTAAPAGAVIFLGSVVVEVLPLPMAWAPEGNLRSVGSGDGGVFASFSSLGASSRSRQRLRDWRMMASSPSMAASSPCGLLRRGAGFCLATMMASRESWVAAWSSVVGSFRRVRLALFGTVGASPAYFPCVACHQCRSCRLLASVAFRWHVPSWLLFHVGGQVSRWCPCHVGCVVSVLARFPVN